MIPECMSQVAGCTWKVVNRNFSSNTYIYSNGEADLCFLVDPGTDTAAIDESLHYLGQKPGFIFCTHGHFDHVGSAAFFQKKYGCPCYLHRADFKTMQSSNFLMMAFGIAFTMEQPDAKDAKELSVVVGDQELRFLPAPGHTPGSCIIQYGQALFTGDTLYSYGVGLSKLPGEDPEMLKGTLLRLWDQIPGEAIICPGHGNCASFASVQRENLPLLNFLGMIKSSPREK